MTTFDDVIHSRIHFAVGYENLGKQARGKVWRSFLDKAGTSQGATAVSEKQLSSLMTAPKTSPENSEEDMKDHCPLVCKPTHCIFCLGDQDKSYEARTFEYSRRNKMMDEVERHLKTFASDDPIPCPHPKCKANRLVLPDVRVFKSHTAKVHKISLHA